MINFIMFIACVVFAVTQAIDANIGWVVANSIMALLHLPYIVMWIKEMIDERKGGQT